MFTFLLLLFSFLSLERKDSHSSGPGMPPDCIDERVIVLCFGIRLASVSQACKLPADEMALRGQNLIGGFCFLIDDGGSSAYLFETLDAEVLVYQ